MRRVAALNVLYCHYIFEVFPPRCQRRVANRILAPINLSAISLSLFNVRLQCDEANHLGNAWGLEAPQQYARSRRCENKVYKGFCLRAMFCRLVATPSAPSKGPFQGLACIAAHVIFEVGALR